MNALKALQKEVAQKDLAARQAAVAKRDAMRKATEAEADVRDADRELERALDARSNAMQRLDSAKVERMVGG